MYRAVTLAFKQHGIIQDGKIDSSRYKQTLQEIEVGFSLNKSKGVYEITLDGTVVENEIRKPEIANCVSIVSHNGYAAPPIQTRGNFK